MDQALTLTDPGGHRVAAILSTPDHPTPRIAVLCHGFLSSKNSTTNKTLTRLLVERQIATLRFDFFGHGDSDGPFHDITVSLALTQALAMLDWATGRGYARIGLVGSSFGGLVAALAAARWSAPRAGRSKDLEAAGGVACLALKCPVIDFAEELELELGQEGLAEWQRTQTVPNFGGGPTRLRLSFAFYQDAHEHIAYEAARRISAPTLIVQGDQDELVPLHQSRRFHDGLQTEKSLHLIPGADHQFTNGDHFRQMTTLLADWLIAHLK